MNNKKCIIDFSAIKTFDYYSKTIEIILEDYTPLFILDGKKILTYENSLEEKMKYVIKYVIIYRIFCLRQCNILPLYYVVVNLSY